MEIAEGWSGLYLEPRFAERAAPPRPGPWHAKEAAMGDVSFLGTLQLQPSTLRGAVSQGCSGQSLKIPPFLLFCVASSFSLRETENSFCLVHSPDNPYDCDWSAHSEELET